MFHVKEFIDQRQEFSSESVCQEAIVTDISEVFIWDVADEPFDKVQYRQGHNFFDIGIVIQILKGNGFTVIEFDSGFTKGRSFEVFAEILYVSLHVI